MFQRISRLICASFACALFGAPALAGTLFVDSNLTTGLNDGSSWGNAFQGTGGLQVALASAVAGDDVYAAEGLYLASSTGTRSHSFQLINGVGIYGGFLGGETSPTDRPAFGTANSVLSGDLAGNDSAGSFGENTFHIIRTVGNNKTALIDGFDVVAGVANSGGGNNDRGGGILCLGAVKPTVRNCRFMDNRSSFGGAAGYCNNGAAPAFFDCTFSGGQGGSYGGAFDIASGGSVRFERCLFENNKANRAGALEVFATTGVIVGNCVFRGNTSTGSGGGGAIWVGTGGNTIFRNCTIVGNFSTVNAVAGMRNQGAGGTVVRNSIFWDNEGPGGAQGSGNQINGSVDATFCVVEGGFAGAGNLGANPQFANIATGDFHLTVTSPAVDSGDNGAAPAGTKEDFDLAPRFVDATAVPDTGLGTAPIVDMGALEFQNPGFTSLPGCFGNPLVLTHTGGSFAVGQSLTLQATSAAQPTGLVLYFAGIDGTDPSGCGISLPGLGEVMLGLVPAPLTIGTGTMAGGVSTQVFSIPATPALVGFEFGFQAANIATLVPGIPIELSNLLVATMQP